MKIDTSPSILGERILAFVDSITGDDLQIHPLVGVESLRPINLGFLCFAIKTLQSIGSWGNYRHKEKLAGAVRRYQAPQLLSLLPFYRNAFLDPGITAGLNGSPAMAIIDLLRTPTRRYPVSRFEQIIVAETKQAIATLAGVGDRDFRLYRGCASSPGRLQTFFTSLDWQSPWAAGGQFSAQMVFASLLPDNTMQLELIRRLVDGLARSDTGGYYVGNAPEYGQLVNGAMKVISGLDWCNLPVHHPDRLIDTVLTRQPASEGCHLVDAVYVLYQCLQFTDHRKKEVQAYCFSMIETIMQHHHPDEGGFSYYRNRAQTNYYGIPITDGENRADIHGTVLLTWALSMLFTILEVDAPGWTVFKP